MGKSEVGSICPRVYSLRVRVGGRAINSSGARSTHNRVGTSCVGPTQGSAETGRVGGEGRQGEVLQTRLKADTNPEGRERGILVRQIQAQRAEKEESWS